MGKLQPGHSKVGVEKGRPKRTFNRNRASSRSKVNYETPSSARRRSR